MKAFPCHSTHCLQRHPLRPTGHRPGRPDRVGVLRNKVASHRKAIQAQKTAIDKQRMEINRQRKSIESDRAAANRQKVVTRKRKDAAKYFGKRLVARTRRIAAASLAAIPAESIPIIGVSVLIAGMAYELYAACQSLRDLEQLYSDMDLADEAPGDVMVNICDPELPAISNSCRSEEGQGNPVFNN